MNAAGQFMAHMELGSQRAPSWELWRKLIGGTPAVDGLGGMFAYDRFELFQGLDDTATSAAVLNRPSSDALTETTVPLPTGGVDGYQLHMTALSKITKRTDVTGNIVQFAPVASDNGLVVLSPGPMIKLANSRTISGLTIFECRLALPTQVTDGSIFAGLATAGAIAAGGLKSNDGKLKDDQAGIGFRVKEDAANEIDFVFQKASTSEVVAKNALQTAVADTFYKLGFVFDPSSPPSKRIQVFLDGAPTENFVTADEIDGSTFPASTSILGPLFAALTEGSTQRLLDLDWFAFYQEYTT